VHETRKGMKRAVEAASALLLATAVTDALGYPGASFYLLVAGVPVAALAGLLCFAEVVDAVEQGRMDLRGRVQAGLLGLLLAAIVLGAAAREPSIQDGSVPAAATAALALGLAALAVQAIVALSPFRRR
jgi:hypothetical protein